jgi:PST family polysaccharide transporter/lipopolysaccharide exporter
LLPATNVTNVLSSVFFPIYSRLQTDSEGLRRTFLAFVKHLSVVAIPAGAMIATTAPLFVPLWFGEQWLPAVPIVQLVSIYGVLASIGGAMIPLCNGVGKPGILVKYYTVSAALAIPAYVFAVQYGVVALAWTHVALVALRVPFYVGIPCRLLGITLRTLWNHVRVGALVGTGLVLFIGALVRVLSDIEGVAPGLLLSGVIAMGLVFWVGTVALIDRRLFSESIAVGLTILAPGGYFRGATDQYLLRRSA